MILDLESVDTPLNLSTDICIIGAGVAGQTLSERLSKYELKTVLIESGDKDFRKDTQSLAKGENIGEPYYDLESARLRLFGGTAAIWGGRCAELDPIDFEQRDYIPHSGWPFLKSELDGYYSEVFTQLDLKRPGAGRLWTEIEQSPPAFSKHKLDTDLWAFDEDGRRFTNVNRPNLSQTDILLNATLSKILVSGQGQVTEIEARSLTGRKADIKAKVFVLAAGAIETVRVLMGAVPSRPTGLGNDHDVLGRYFMEHPHARAGQIIPENVAQTLSVLPRAIRHKGQRYAAYMRPAPDLQREKGILNTSISFAPRRHEGENLEIFRATTNLLKHELPSTQFWREFYGGLKRFAIRGLEKTDPWSSVLNMKASRGKMGVYAIARAEQSPNPQSRITLGSEVDALGLPRPQLDWRLSDIDGRSLRVLMETLNEEYRRLGWGRVEPSPWLLDETTQWKTDPLISAHAIGGYHHMGGTRMGTDVKTSVVNADCRLHDSANLYIASSSVFPTGGWANPTITIMALALRLGDHLGQKLRKK